MEYELKILFTAGFNLRAPNVNTPSAGSISAMLPLLVPANIVEGYKRLGKADKIRFYNIAQSSLEEVKYFLFLSL